MALKDIVGWSNRRRGGVPDLLDLFRSTQDDMERMFSSFRSPGLWATPGAMLGEDGLAVPSLDIAEDDKGLEIKMDVPGVAPQNLDVSIEDGVLTVSGTREEEKTEGAPDKSWHRVERFKGRFVRRIALPSGIDEAQVEARQDAGVLTIRLPKNPAERERQRRIEVKATA